MNLIVLQMFLTMLINQLPNYLAFSYGYICIRIFVHHQFQSICGHHLIRVIISFAVFTKAPPADCLHYQRVYPLSLSETHISFCNMSNFWSVLRLKCDFLSKSTKHPIKIHCICLHINCLQIVCTVYIGQALS